MVGLSGTVHPHHAETQRVIFGKAPLAEQGQPDGGFGSLGELTEFIDGAGEQNPAPGEDDRTLGGTDEGPGPVDLLVGGHGHRLVAG